YGTGGGLELAEHQFEQGTLARAVVADQADAVPPQDMGGQLTDQRRLARPGEADLVQLDHPLARRIGSLQLETGLALTFDTPCAFLAHGLECPYPAFVTGTPGLDALADPGFLLGQLLVEQRIGRRLGLQLLLLVLEEAAVVPLPVDQLTAVQLQDPRRQGL